MVSMTSPNFLQMLIGQGPQARPKTGPHSGRPRPGLGSVLNQVAPQEGVAAPGGVSPVDPMASEELPPIEVVGNQYNPMPSNRNAIEDIQLSQEETPERKGMFGIKGTARDILGLIGDSFLVGSGRDRMYYPERQREMAGDAMAGFTGGEEEARAAAERLAYLGHTDAAQKLLDQLEQRKLRQQQVESLQANRQSLQDDRAAGNYTNAMDRIGRLLGTEEAQQNLPQALQIAERIASAYNTTLEELGITPNMTPAEMRMLAGSDMTVNQQRSIPIRQQNANTAERNSRRPRPQRAPRAQTDSERAIAIGNKDPSERTAGEQQWFERYNRSGSGGGSGRRSVPRSSNRDTSGWSVRRN